MTEETKTKQQIKDYLNLKGIDWFYNAQGLGSYKGLSDLTILRNGKSIYAEIKTPKGKLSPYQEKFKEMCKRNKNQYWVIRSLDELIEKLK